MNYLENFSDVSGVKVCLAGAGSFGISLLRQADKIAALSIRIVIERDAKRARQILESVGIASDRIRECRDAAGAREAWDAGFHVAVGDVATVIDLPFDILVEATGIPEIGARHAIAAIEAGKHVGIATKETESVVGPYLTHAALERGRIFTPLDGDQPSLLIGLVTWAWTLGFEVVSAGKSSEYDFVWQEGTGEVVRNGVRHAAPAMSDVWTMGDDGPATAAARAAAAPGVPRIAAPDLCEMTNVANATGLRPDIPTLHAPILRVLEVADLFDLAETGGLLAGPGRVEVFNCLRKPDELSFAGGVFVVVRCGNDEDWALLEEKGHVLSKGRRSALLYLPRHLLGLEAAVSILDAVGRNTTSGGGRETAPHQDLVGRATRAFRAGHQFRMEGHHREFDGVQPEMHPARPIDNGGAAPFYMLDSAVLGRDIAEGEIIAFEALADVPSPTLLRLRRAQDAQFMSR